MAGQWWLGNKRADSSWATVHGCAACAGQGTRWAKEQHRQEGDRVTKWGNRVVKLVGNRLVEQGEGQGQQNGLTNILHAAREQLPPPAAGQRVWVSRRREAMWQW